MKPRAVIPKPKGKFDEKESFALLVQYRKDPSSLECPTCGPRTIEILAFIEPEIHNNWATVTEPVSSYAAVVYCHRCERAIGLLNPITED